MVWVGWFVFTRHKQGSMQLWNFIFTVAGKRLKIADLCFE